MRLGSNSSSWLFKFSRIIGEMKNIPTISTEPIWRFYTTTDFFPVHVFDQIKFTFFKRDKSISDSCICFSLWMKRLSFRRSLSLFFSDSLLFSWHTTTNHYKLLSPVFINHTSYYCLTCILLASTLIDFIRFWPISLVNSGVLINSYCWQYRFLHDTFDAWKDT